MTKIDIIDSYIPVSRIWYRWNDWRDLKRLQICKSFMFFNHFTAKVKGIRAATANAPVAEFKLRATSSFSASMQAMTTEEIIALLNDVPPKHCDLETVPTWLVKKVTVVVAPA